MFPSDDRLLPLIRAMGTGDRTALREFIGEVAPWLHSVHLRATSQSVAAAVLVERTLEELWRSSPLYDKHQGDPRAWIMAVARLQANQYTHKRRGREHRLKSRPDAEGVPAALSGTGDQGMEAAFEDLDSSDRELLESVWFNGIPGGVEGERLRLRFAQLLPELVTFLAGTEAVD